MKICEMSLEQCLEDKALESITEKKKCPNKSLGYHSTFKKKIKLNPKQNNGNNKEEVGNQ